LIRKEIYAVVVKEEIDNADAMDGEVVTEME